MAHGAIERRMPVPVDAAYQALLTAAHRRFTVKVTDDTAKTVHFSSKASLFTWGENFVAQVLPSGTESSIRVHASAREGGLLADLVATFTGTGASAGTGKAHTARRDKLVTALFDDVLALLRDKAGAE